MSNYSGCEEAGDGSVHAPVLVLLVACSLLSLSILDYGRKSGWVVVGQRGRVESEVYSE